LLVVVVLNLLKSSYKQVQLCWVLRVMYKYWP